MKTTNLLISFAFLFVCIKSYSQEKKIFLGLKGGLNYSVVSTESIFSEPEYKPGLCAGFNLGYKMHKNILLLIEVDFDQKGYKDPLALTDGSGNPIENTEIKYAFNYVTVPISINYSTGSKSNFETGIGIYNSILTSAQLKMKGILVDGEPLESVNIKDNYKSYEPGIFVRAAGAICLTSRLGLLIETRYSHGFSSIFKETEVKIINSGFFFGTGLRFYFLTKTK